MYLYILIAVLLIVIFLMSWIWYFKPKLQVKNAIQEFDSLKHEFEVEYHELIASLVEYKHSYDMAKTLLQQIQILDKEKKSIENIGIQVTKDLEQKSYEIIHISHQMRTSLSGLLGFTHFLEVTEMTEEQKEFVSIIATSSNELLTLVNNIIDMTPKPRTDEVTDPNLNRDVIEVPKNDIPHVLVVDDNEINKKLLATVLEKLDLDVTYASNGREAVALREAYNFDIIFMDIQMPVMNGVEASKAIRKFEDKKHLSHVPIVALTANTGKNDRDTYLDAGMTDYIAKPVMIEDLRSRIEELQSTMK